MTHETDIQRITLELQGYAQRGIKRNRDHRNLKLAMFWIAVGAIAGTLIGISVHVR